MVNDGFLLEDGSALLTFREMASEVVWQQGHFRAKKNRWHSARNNVDKDSE